MNVVYLAGLLRVEAVKRVEGLSILMEAVVIDEKEGREYPMYLTGKQAELVIERNHAGSKHLPTVVVSGRLFNLDDKLVVLGKYIDFVSSD